MSQQHLELMLPTQEPRKQVSRLPNTVLEGCDGHDDQPSRRIVNARDIELGARRFCQVLFGAIGKRSNGDAERQTCDIGTMAESMFKELARRRENDSAC